MLVKVETLRLAELMQTLQQAYTALGLYRRNEMPASYVLVVDKLLETIPSFVGHYDAVRQAEVSSKENADLPHDPKVDELEKVAFGLEDGTPAPDSTLRVGMPDDNPNGPPILHNHDPNNFRFVLTKEQRDQIFKSTTAAYTQDDVAAKFQKLVDALRDLENHAWLARLRSGNVAMSPLCGQDIAGYIDDVIRLAGITPRPARVDSDKQGV